jgi:hypothetical protein
LIEFVTAMAALLNFCIDYLALPFPFDQALKIRPKSCVLIDTPDPDMSINEN